MQGVLIRKRPHGAGSGGILNAEKLCGFMRFCTRFTQALKCLLQWAYRPNWSLLSMVMLPPYIIGTDAENAGQRRRKAHAFS